jgi:outer membrane protein OmpA-like peptidoglycan-associated protein
VNLGNKINSGLEEYSPAFTIDEKTIYITHRDPKYQNEDIYYAYKENGEWTQAKPIGSPINTADNEGAFSVSADGRYIFFTSCKRPGGVGQCDLWLTIDKNGRWTDPVNLGPVINSRNWESQPSLASNGKDLYFTSDRSGGFGGTDLYHSSFSDTGWSKPRNLGPTINTSRDEQFPFIHPDGNTLYFSSEGHPGMGKSDLFITRKLPGNKWANPENLGFPINSAGNDWNLVVSRDGKTAYYSSDKLKEGFGGMDIYSFQLPENLQAKQVNYASGVVKDFNTKVPLGAVVLLTPLDGSTPTRTIAPERTGSFMVALVANTRYALTIEKRGYLFHSEYFDMPNSTADKPFELEIFLKTIEVGNSIVLKNVFFDTDKFDLKVESNTELDKLAELLNSNSTLKIQIGGHTDNQGSESHNITLSKNRANAVFNYLISKGITGSRMTFKGFGASQPIASNETKEGRALNRRTEFKIVD